MMPFLWLLRLLWPAEVAVGIECTNVMGAFSKKVICTKREFTMRFLRHTPNVWPNQRKNGEHLHERNYMLETNESFIHCYEFYITAENWIKLGKKKELMQTKNYCEKARRSGNSNRALLNYITFSQLNIYNYMCENINSNWILLAKVGCIAISAPWSI